ncbi:MAG: dTDP-4-dehydrorhamnose 3,5-epimerase [Alphaproteobacteria bacterium]|nr:MAG: dTDP-4-dehydrorhamnose 3,5-epimerase [Alphaproteobacteria bacterium]
MKITETNLSGVYLIEPDFIEDSRGFFTRAFCQDEFASAGIDFAPVQSNISHNRLAYTLRGMHFQAAPYAETKLVRCTSGRLFDVAVDLRESSPTYRQWTGLDLSRQNAKALFIPAGCAHGFLTLEDETEVFYQMSPAFVPGHDRGFRFDDPAIGITWPKTPKVISEKDLALPLFDEAEI